MVVGWTSEERPPPSRSLAKLPPRPSSRGQPPATRRPRPLCFSACQQVNGATLAVIIHVRHKERIRLI